MTDDDLVELEYDWRFWARPDQVAPEGDWFLWFLMGGRGAGKTRTGAEWIRHEVEHGGARRIALVGETVADVRDVMIRGESGILSISRPDFMPEYVPSSRTLYWPNGAEAHTYSAKTPGQLRGPQHDRAWADEVAKWQYPEAFDNLIFGLRARNNARGCVTSTPRAMPIVRDLVAQSKLKGGDVVLTHATTYDNLLNLDERFIKNIVRRYEGTRLGRQELLAILLEDIAGALWQRFWIERSRVLHMPDLTRIVVAVDPQASSDPESEGETGIVVAGKAGEHGYVLEDLTVNGTPDVWSEAVVEAYHKWEADLCVGEINNGGEMIGHLIKTAKRGKSVNYQAISASRSKQARAEPVAALYKNQLAHHLGYHTELEDELCTWVPGTGMPSPNRLDAVTWALTVLLIEDDPQIKSITLPGFGGSTGAGLRPTADDRRRALFNRGRR